MVFVNSLGMMQTMGVFSRERREDNKKEKKQTTQGFPPTKKFDGRTYYFVGGSVQYFGGDVERITTALKKQGIRFRTELHKPILPDNTRFWLIYVEKQNIHLDNFR